MKILVKLGGTLLDSVDSRQRLAAELAPCVHRACSLSSFMAAASK